MALPFAFSDFLALGKERTYLNASSRLGRTFICVEGRAAALDEGWNFDASSLHFNAKRFWRVRDVIAWVSFAAFIKSVFVV